MQGVIADAVADLKATYEHREVVTEELPDGQVWVMLTGVVIGVVLSLAREQMAPAIRPKRMLKFKAKPARASAATQKTARKRA